MQAPADSISTGVIKQQHAACNQWKLELDSVLSVGRWSVVMRGKANGKAVAIKFFGPDAQELAAWTNEMRVYGKENQCNA